MLFFFRVKGENCLSMETFHEGSVHGRRGGVDVARIVFGDDVLEQRPGVAQTLQDRVHETRVADVAETHQTRVLAQSVFPDVLLAGGAAGCLR